jgi:hypothetical protein
MDQAPKTSPDPLPELAPVSALQPRGISFLLLYTFFYTTASAILSPVLVLLPRAAVVTGAVAGEGDGGEAAGAGPRGAGAASVLRGGGGAGGAVAASARRAHRPPSTAPIRTSALPIRLPAPAHRRLAVGGDGGELGLPCPWGPAAGLTRSLCRLQRNEPGWLVGEHMHVRRPRDDEDTLTLTGCPASETRVGEAER